MNEGLAMLIAVSENR